MGAAARVIPVADRRGPGHGTGMSTVKAQSPGVFYRKPSPDADPYTAEGGHVDAGQTIALIEAVKTYSPVRAEHSGTVRFLLTDGDEVQVGQTVLEVDDE